MIPLPPELADELTQDRSSSLSLILAVIVFVLSLILLYRAYKGSQ